MKLVCVTGHCLSIYTSALLLCPCPLLFCLMFSLRVLDLQEIYMLLAQELSTLASAHGERLLHTPHNPISLGKLNLQATGAINLIIYSRILVYFAVYCVDSFVHYCQR